MGLGGIGSAIAGIGAVSGIFGAAGAAIDAKAQKKAIKARRDADIAILKADTDATLKSLAADSEAQQQVIQSEAQARIKASLYEADTEGQNVQIARLLARDALGRGLLDEFSFRRDASQAQGQQRARLASSGVDINSGSAAWLQEELIVATDLDALSIRQNAAREAYGFDLEAYGAGRRQKLVQMEAASTGDVAEANIAGLRNVAKIRAEGIRKTSKVNEKAIRKVAEKSIDGISPARSAFLTGGATLTNFASSWYLSGKLG